jgi:hypothetical protein
VPPHDLREIERLLFQHEAYLVEKDREHHGC